MHHYSIYYTLYIGMVVRSHECVDEGFEFPYSTTSNSNSNTDTKKDGGK